MEEARGDGRSCARLTVDQQRRGRQLVPSLAQVAQRDVHRPVEVASIPFRTASYVNNRRVAEVDAQLGAADLVRSTSVIVR